MATTWKLCTLVSKAPAFHERVARAWDIIASWTAFVHWQDEKRNMGFWPGSR